MAAKRFIVSMALVTALSTVAAFGVAAQGQPLRATAPAKPSSVLTISMFAFSSLSVKAGSKFTVVNKDSADHTLHLAGTKIDPLVKAGSSVQVTAPSKPAKYKVTCDFHPSMHGVLTVTK
jgi:plastocyanin